MDNISRNIRDNLLRLRGSADYTQEYVGTVVGVSKGMVGNWERGMSRPNLDHLIKLAELYGVTIDDLLKEAE